MVEGLDVTVDEFKKLPITQRHIVLYKNVSETRKSIDLLHIELLGKVTEYRFHRKVQYWWLGVLTTVVLAITGLKAKFGLP